MTKMKHNTMMRIATCLGGPDQIAKRRFEAASPDNAGLFLKCVSLTCKQATSDTLCREEPDSIGSTYFHTKV